MLANTKELTVVFGACSAIAQEWIELRAKCGDEFYLVDYQQEKLEIFANHISIKYQSQVRFFAADLVKTSGHTSLLQKILLESNKPLNRVFIAYGFLGDQELAQSDWALAEKIIDVNFTSCISLLTHLKPIFISQKTGKVICLSSVAGDRGRASNYVYGAAKAGLTAFLSGFRASLSNCGVKVITVKPGMVDTPMTSNMKKGPLFSKPEVVAKAIFSSENKGATTVYTPFWWRFIMFIIMHIPEKIFMKLKF